MTGSTRDRREVEAFLRLKAARRMGDRRIRKLVEVHGSAVATVKAVLGQGDLWTETPPAWNLSAFLKAGSHVVPMTSPEYPQCLLELEDPPPLLFLKGRRQLLESPTVAMVGSRRATQAGRRVAQEMARRLSELGIPVVSGMALGIDGAAHRGGLSGPGSTVAVLGSGLALTHPSSHRGLKERIQRDGLLVSEFLPEEPARPFHFPKRNRIIAALARAVIVVEAGARSGALITVDHALDLGREVLSVPGSVENPQARGSNALLRDGARLLTGPEAVEEELSHLLPAKGPVDEPGRVPHALPSELRELWSVLSSEPLSLDQLAHKAHVAVSEALAGLTALEMGGWAVRCPGMHFQRARGSGA
jgi:DNA processing protein